MIVKHLLICKTGLVDIVLSAINTAKVEDRSGLTTWSVQATRGQLSNVDTKNGVLITVYTVRMYQSAATMVSATLQQPSTQFSADKFCHIRNIIFFQINRKRECVLPIHSDFTLSTALSN